MAKWSTAERVVFEQTVLDKIEAVVGKLNETGKKADSKNSWAYDYRNYSAPKIRKVHIGGVTLRPPAPKMQVSTCGIHPAYEYDIPRFALEWLERQEHTMFIVDLHPVKDIILYPDYVEKYLAPLHPIFNKSLEIPGTKTDLTAPSPRQYPMADQYSRYAIHGEYVPEQTEQAWDLALKFLDVWLEDWKKGEPLKDSEEKKLNERRFEAMSELYRTLDPGARFWIRLGGEKLAKEMQGFSW